MTAEALERVRFYVASTGRVSRIAAQNCHHNGYHETARKHENEATLSDLILADLNAESPSE
jgi:hypothetical protein